MATVKEQAAGVFAEALGKRGLLALAFDYRRFGESEGEPRQYEDPASKTDDVQAAISFLCAHENVDSQRVGALGICASSSYIAAALTSDRRVRAFGTVSAHFSLREFFTANPLVTEEVLEQLLAASNAARQRYDQTGSADPDAMVWPDMTGEEEGAFYQDIYDYYFRRVAECWPRFSNHLVPFSLQQLVRSHALDCASQIVVPYLGVAGSEAVTRSYTERFVEAKARGSNSIEIIEGARHIQTYDKPEFVSKAVDALAGFFQQHLAA
jgi:pimeloyl-ACP methyl ester carboxylesterase